MPSSNIIGSRRSSVCQFINDPTPTTSIDNKQQVDAPTTNNNNESSSSEIIQSSNNDNLSNASSSNINQPKIEQTPLGANSNITIEKLLLIPPELIQNKNPRLYSLLKQLRDQFMFQVLTNPLPLNNDHPFEKMKQDDSRVFAPFVEDIYQVVEKLLKEMDWEEYQLLENECGKYKTRLEQEDEEEDQANRLRKNTTSELTESQTINTPPSEVQTIVPNLIIENNAANDISTNNNVMDEDEESNMTDEEEDSESMGDEEEEEEEIILPGTNQNLLPSLISPTTGEDQTKVQDFLHNLQNVEPIPNGKLSFLQSHHLVVGKFDRNQLVENNVLSCTIMKKSTLSIVVQRRCTKRGLTKDKEFSANKILKKQAMAKSVVRFTKVKVDFNPLVESILQSSKNQTIPNVNLSNLNTFLQA
ncbi:hypothetical protein ABK040_014457 [Willaertia magna]